MLVAFVRYWDSSEGQQGYPLMEIAVLNGVAVHMDDWKGPRPHFAEGIARSMAAALDQVTVPTVDVDATEMPKVFSFVTIVERAMQKLGYVRVLGPRP